MKKFIAALGVVLSLMLGTAAIADDVTRIKGIVSDSSSGSKIGGAVISNGTAQTTSASDGTFRLVVPPGYNTLTVSKTGYQTLTKTVYAKRYETTEIKLKLTKTAVQQCTYTYTDWGACQADSTQTRTVLGSSPDGCSGTPVTTQTCVYVPPACTYTYSDWSACQPNDLQTRTVVSADPPGCVGDPVTTMTCVYVPPVCQYTYTDWGTCQYGDFQTRTVTSVGPAGCVGSAVTTQTCTYVPPVCTDFTYSDWSACSVDGVQTRTVLSSGPLHCVGGNPVTSQACTPTCQSFTYSDWSTCASNNTQTRTVVSTTPNVCTGGNPVTTQACTYVPVSLGTSFKVFANNDLGMHCVDSSFAVFSILPPYNVVDAQVVALQSSGKPVVLNQSQVDVRFSAVADAAGSTNSTSIGKSDFWNYSLQLYGAPLAPGQGLEGMWMPADAPDQSGRTLVWDLNMGLFKAPGIPIFPIDDNHGINSYPLMRFSAYDKNGKLLGSSDTVLPVSDETSCQSCHTTGGPAAPVGTLAWSNDPDLEAQARRNVLILHNNKTGTNLQPPVLCATCHYSPALDLTAQGQTPEQLQHKTMSNVMHSYHADKMIGYNDAPVPKGGTPPNPALQSCYQCHPGASTQCLRGAMTDALSCQNCHGNMAAVGGKYPLLTGGSIDGTNDGGTRRPWLDLPRCDSCHANDAVVKTTVSNSPPLAADGLRFIDAFQNNDPSASPIKSANPRFAAETGKLYRKSKGHGGLACEACHGSTHAVWPVPQTQNDDVIAVELQGHTGLIGECSTCHQAPPSNNLGGPHGMHPVGQAWIGPHRNAAESNRSSCQPCHGTDYRGTVLSRMFTTRTLTINDGRTITLAKNQVVGCYNCHNGPNP